MWISTIPRSWAHDNVALGIDVGKSFTLVFGIGGMLAAITAVLVALTQQLLNFYAVTGAGDIAVVVLLALVLLARPQGLLGRVAR